MTTTSNSVRALLIEGPDAGRIMQVQPGEQNSLSLDEQEAWNALMATAQRTEERALRVRQKSDDLLAELRRVRALLESRSERS